MSSIPSAAPVALDPFMTEIETNTLGSAAASISFSSGLSDYKMFRVSGYVVKDGTGARIRFRFNGDTAGNVHSFQRLDAGNTSLGGTRISNDNYIEAIMQDQIDANANGMFEIYIAKQQTGNAAMTVSLGTTIVTAIKAGAIAGIWANTASLITSIDFFCHDGSNFAAGTVMVLDGDGSS